MIPTTNLANAKMVLLLSGTVKIAEPSISPPEVLIALSALNTRQRHVALSLIFSVFISV